MAAVVDVNEVLEKLTRIGVVFHGAGLRDAIANASDWRQALVDAARWGRDEGVWLSRTTLESPTREEVARVLAGVMEEDQVRAVTKYLAPPSDIDIADLVANCALTGRPLYVTGGAAEVAALLPMVDQVRRHVGRPVTVVFTASGRSLGAALQAPDVTATRH